MANWFRSVVRAAPPRSCLTQLRTPAPGSGGVAQADRGACDARISSSPAGRLPEESPSRCLAPHPRVGARGRQLEGEKRQLQADLFGRRSETTPLNDRSNHLDDPQDDSQHPRRKLGQQPENPGPKRRDYSSLPVRQTFVDLPHEQCVCLDCGQPLRLRSDTEDSDNRDRRACLPPQISPARYERTCACEGS